jgi:hypothetical protein
MTMHVRLEAAQAALPFTVPRLIAIVPNTVSPRPVSKHHWRPAAFAWYADRYPLSVAGG